MLLALEIFDGTSLIKLIWKTLRIFFLGGGGVHFRETFQICRSEVEQLQIYIDKKLVGFFIFYFLFFWNYNRVAIE